MHLSSSQNSINKKGAQQDNRLEKNIPQKRKVIEQTPTKKSAKSKSSKTTSIIEGISNAPIVPTLPTNSEESAHNKAHHKAQETTTPYLTDAQIKALSTRAERREAKLHRKTVIAIEKEYKKNYKKYKKRYPAASEDKLRKAAKEEIKLSLAKKHKPIGAMILMLLGLVMLVLPIILDYQASLTAQDSITSYTQSSSVMDQEKKDMMLAQAKAYNDKLCSLTSPSEADIKQLDYYKVMDVTGTGIMGSITIDSIGVNQPIYHGTAENVLMAGVGHMENTSLPFASGGSHAVIAGHSGMPGQRMFDEIIYLEPGDLIKISMLGMETWYRVSDTETVPARTEMTFLPEKGKDKLTLVTCVPYGINSHRLLINCDKVDPEEIATASTPLSGDKAAKYFNLRTIPIILAVGLVILLIIICVRRSRKEKVKKRLLTSSTEYKDEDISNKKQKKTNSKTKRVKDIPNENENASNKEESREERRNKIRQRTEN